VTKRSRTKDCASAPRKRSCRSFTGQTLDSVCGARTAVGYASSSPILSQAWKRLIISSLKVWTSLPIKTAWVGN
jgi:hypothetical protein